MMTLEQSLREANNVLAYAHRFLSRVDDSQSSSNRPEPSPRAVGARHVTRAAKSFFKALAIERLFQSAEGGN
jgi:hypothetical protein